MKSLHRDDSFSAVDDDTEQPCLAEPVRRSSRTINLAATVLATFLLTQFGSAQASAYQKIFEQAGKFTVKIKRTTRHAFAGDRIGTSSGAGFLVDRDRGLIVTNAHVTGRSPASISVSFKGKRSVKAQPVYIDPELDLAILKIGLNSLPFTAIPARLDCSPGGLVGRQVATMGHPRGLSFSATTGIISRVAFGWGNEHIQTNLPTNSGNSGGAVIDVTTGLVVGVHAASLRKSQGIGLAVPSRHLCKILSLVREGRNPSPPDLGLDFASHWDSGTNLYVVGGRIPSVFEKFKTGDRILVANGMKLRNPTDLSTALRGMRGKVEVVFEREGKRLTVQVPVRPKPLVTDRKGLMVDGALFSNDVYSQRKFVENLLSVHSVTVGSRAESKGIRRFYRLLMSNSKRIETLEDLERQLLDAEKGNDQRMVFRKHSKTKFTIYDHFIINMTSPRIRWIEFPKAEETKLTSLRGHSRNVRAE